MELQRSLRRCGRLLRGIWPACLAIFCLQAAPAYGQDGSVRFFAVHSPAWDEWTETYDESVFAFMNSKYDDMLVYSSWWNGFRDDHYQRGWLYVDGYAISPLDTNFQQLNLLRYALRDANGNPLYIDYACDSSGTRCQYAADVGNQTWRNYFISQLSEKLAANTFAGIWIDDVNFDWRISDRSGRPIIPMDPRTGQQMTLANWRRYYAEFLEQIRAAFPAHKIAHNPIWYASGTLTGDPYIRRQILAADYQNYEGGIQRAIHGGSTSKYSLHAYLNTVQLVHFLGRGTINEDFSSTESKRNYSLAGYLLLTSGNDYHSNTQIEYAAPSLDLWWRGFDITLGYATSGILQSGSLRWRNFQCGATYLNEPEAPTITYLLPPVGYTNALSGEPVESFTLRAKEAVILRKPCDAQSGGCHAAF